MRRVGKYQLLEQIASDTKAQTYRAQLEGRAGFQKTVILKCLQGEAKRNLDAVKRFVDEARVAALIQHKNVVQVLELGQTLENEFFMVMEFVDGCDLHALLRASLAQKMRIPPWLSVHIACEVLEGLAHAHDLADPRRKKRALIHRNVTPHNIFISRLGDIKLGDFGTTRSANSLPPGQVEGKVPYLAPEMIQGRPVDHRADLHALGVVLWECLTQRRLFKRTLVADTLRLICARERPTPSLLAPGIPNDLDRATQKALSLRAEERFSDARAMQEELLDIRGNLAPNLRSDDVQTALEILMRGHVVSAKPRPGSGRENVGDYSVIHPKRVKKAPPRLPPKKAPGPKPRGPKPRGRPRIVPLPPPPQRFPPPLRSAPPTMPSAAAAEKTFWIDSGSQRIGPLSFAELMRRLGDVPSLRRPNVRISSDRREWFSVSSFLRLNELPAQKPTSSE